VQRRLAAGAVERAAQDLAVDGHHTRGYRTGRSSGRQAAALLGEPGHEAPERGAERLWIKLAEQAAERVVARRNVSTTLIQPGLEFRLGWSGRLCGIELSEAAGFLV